jgi:hypothetical protein
VPVHLAVGSVTDPSEAVQPVERLLPCQRCRLSLVLPHSSMKTASCRARWPQIEPTGAQAQMATPPSLKARENPLSADVVPPISGRRSRVTFCPVSGVWPLGAQVLITAGSR